MNSTLSEMLNTSAVFDRVCKKCGINNIISESNHTAHKNFYECRNCSRLYSSNRYNSYNKRNGLWNDQKLNTFEVSWNGENVYAAILDEKTVCLITQSENIYAPINEVISMQIEYVNGLKDMYKLELKAGCKRCKCGHMNVSTEITEANRPHAVNKYKCVECEREYQEYRYFRNGKNKVNAYLLPIEIAVSKKSNKRRLCVRPEALVLIYEDGQFKSVKRDSVTVET